MPRECIFCGEPANSQEHVWPNWAAPLLADEGLAPHLHQIVRDGQIEAEWTYEKTPYTVTVGVVCKDCNNGWMARLEERAKPFLDAALHGRGRLLHEAGQQTLAAWALKTSMTAARTQGTGRGVIPPEEHTYLHQHGEPSSRVRIWMTAYTGAQMAAMGLMNGFDVDMEASPDPNRGWRHVWTATVAFGTVVFQVFGSVVPELLDVVKPDTANTHVLWPHVGPFTWVPAPGLSDGDLMAFGDGLLSEVRRYADGHRRKLRASG
jgi:hypothetical protein